MSILIVVFLQTQKITFPLGTSDS